MSALNLHKTAAGQVRSEGWQVPTVVPTVSTINTLPGGSFQRPFQTARLDALRFIQMGSCELEYAAYQVSTSWEDTLGY